jgi:hypothetical protein
MRSTPLGGNRPIIRCDYLTRLTPLKRKNGTAIDAVEGKRLISLSISISGGREIET